MESAAENGRKGHIISYDLHIHSNISDGTFSPYEIIDQSLKKGLKGISITDHDDIDHNHIDEAAREKGLKYIYGMEFSTDTNNLHIIGYNLDIENLRLKEYIDFQKNEREKALRKMCKKTVECGIPIQFKELKKFNTRSLGRPHMAAIMMEKGYVENFYEAFSKYLRNDKSVFVDYEKYHFLEIIDIILESNGTPILAHPGMLRDDVFQSIFKNALKRGLAGLEAYYPRHSIRQTKTLIEIAKKNGLVITGGSDFHGETKPDIKIGDAGISEEEFEKFANRMGLES
ncbi:MAG: PHP domain-containing protein [Spirochaetes bacterium]|nr:PHP domain-containing protein [Spirochaetota bacterium]